MGHGPFRKWGSVQAIAACFGHSGGGGLRRRVSSGAAAAMAVPAVAATGPGTVVPAQMFGIHVISSSNPNLPSGSVRMALLPSWREVEGIRGHHDWRKFDGVLSLYESWGFTDILYCIGGTPLWAAGTRAGIREHCRGGWKGCIRRRTSPTTRHTSARSPPGTRGASPRMRWNEPTTPQFYRGTPR